MANFDLNLGIKAGRLTADPELRTTPNGVSVCSFCVAVGRRSARDEERKSDFFNCIAWRGTAEFVARYFHKGDSICVVGAMHNNRWQDRDGNARDKWEFVADQAMFVDGKSDRQPQAVQLVDASADPVADDDLPF